MACFLFTTILCALVYSAAFLKFSLGADTLSANQTIADGQTLISQNQNFVLGFFSPAHPETGSWGYGAKNTTDVIVWFPNRNNHVRDSQGVLFEVARIGTLVISRAGSIVWSSNSSGVASNPILQLLDTGNLLLVDKTSEAHSSQISSIRQSFNYPSDTRLPGMRMVYNPDTGLDKHLTSWKSYDDPSPGDFIYSIENQASPKMAWLLWKGKKALELMDECLNDSFVEFQAKRCIQMGLLCVQKQTEDRPVMSSVLFMLGCDGAVLSEPQEPGFFSWKEVPLMLKVLRQDKTPSERQ
ncbi:hypothetical protein Pfo_027987 [Paulownia fortunei]|nr:hypothetical protein Pfo_027987 [Paulownia fortunei]